MMDFNYFIILHLIFKENNRSSRIIQNMKTFLWWVSHVDSKSNIIRNNCAPKTHVPFHSVIRQQSNTAPLRKSQSNECFCYFFKNYRGILKGNCLPFLCIFIKLNIAITISILLGCFLIILEQSFWSCIFDFFLCH